MVPIHVLDAPAPGTGKSYVLDVASTVITGRPQPVLGFGRDNKEFEKRIAACIIEGDTIISIDNVTRPLGGEALNRVTSQPIVTVRILGRTERVKVEFRGLFSANGNNIAIEGDMTRRTLLGRLDTGMERPEEREFADDPVKLVLADRGKYLAAALVIVRAYIAAGMSGRLKPLAGYQEWSDCVRSALVWLGAGDPCATMRIVREQDRVLGTLTTVLACWHAAFGEEKRTAKRAIEQASKVVLPPDKPGKPPEILADDHPLRALGTALGAVCTVRGELDGDKLGKWLRDNKGRVAKGLRFVEAGTVHSGAKAWRVEVVPAGEAGDASEASNEG
jgi:putative DNA primase/helicase